MCIFRDISLSIERRERAPDQHSGTEYRNLGRKGMRGSSIGGKRACREEPDSREVEGTKAQRAIPVGAETRRGISLDMGDGHGGNDGEKEFEEY